MLEQLFGSKTRVKLLRLFLNNPEQSYFLRQLSRQINEQLTSVRREVNNLEKMGIIMAASKKTTKKYFIINSEFILYPELKALMLKAQLLLERDFIREIEQCAKVYFLLLTGFFVGLENYPTDMILVGNVNKNKLAKLIKRFEKQLNHNINYTIMKLSEFKYRQDITDRFLYDILEGKKAVIIDKING